MGQETEPSKRRTDRHAQGIPFATAGRFEHPQLYTEQLGDFDGSSYGPICPQKTTASILSMNSSSSLVLGEAGTAIGPVVGALADTVFNTIGQTRSEACSATCRPPRTPQGGTSCPW